MSLTLGKQEITILENQNYKKIDNDKVKMSETEYPNHLMSTSIDGYGIIPLYQCRKYPVSS